MLANSSLHLDAALGHRWPSCPAVTHSAAQILCLWCSVWLIYNHPIAGFDVTCPRYGKQSLYNVLFQFNFLCKGQNLCDICQNTLVEGLPFLILPGLNKLQYCSFSNTLDLPLFSKLHPRGQCGVISLFASNNSPQSSTACRDIMCGDRRSKHPWQTEWRALLQVTELRWQMKDQQVASKLRCKKTKK